MKTNLKLIASSLFISLALLSPQVTLASYETLPTDIRKMILKQVAQDSIAADKTFGEVAAVNHRWAADLGAAVNEDLQPWQPCWKAYLGITAENENVYRQFYNGVLEYRKDPSDPEPTLTLPFAALMNLFSDRTFDLSKCGDASKYLRITTSVKEFFKVKEENSNKVVILACPYNVIKKNHAAKFEVSMQKWEQKDAPVGLFWRWGDFEDLSWYDYLTCLSLEAMAVENLEENWYKCGTAPPDATAHAASRSVGEEDVLPEGSCFVFKFV